MGLAESSQHVPNPLFSWKPKIAAVCASRDPIVTATSWVRPLFVYVFANCNKGKLENAHADHKRKQKMNSLVVLPKPPYTVFVSRGPAIYCYKRSESTKSLVLNQTIVSGDSEVRFIFLSAQVSQQLKKKFQMMC